MVLLRIAVFAVTCLAAVVGHVSAQGRTENVVLMTIDGARYQEVFGGLDAEILQSTTTNPVDTLPVHRQFWAANPEERRLKLMPFFWGTLMTQGSIAGNPAAGSTVRITNGHRFSYPGYSEILTGEAKDDVIKSNDPIQNPFETVLEFVKRRLGLEPRQVAAFTSWGAFSGIAEHVKGTITTNAGIQRAESDDPAVQQLNDLQFEILSPWDVVRPDAFTFRLAMAHLKAHKPRLLYLALDETDDWAHDGKYELMLRSYTQFDRYLRELWHWLESDTQYRGKTTLIVTTDHGRGRTATDWRSHGKDVDGAQDIWIAFVSPDSPRRGEWRDTEPLFQNQVAATVARLLGLDFRELRPTAGPPISSLWTGPVSAPTR